MITLIITSKKNYFTYYEKNISFRTLTNTSTVVRNIDEFVTKALEVINQLEEYTKTKLAL